MSQDLRKLRLAITEKATKSEFLKRDLTVLRSVREPPGDLPVELRRLASAAYIRCL